MIVPRLMCSSNFPCDCRSHEALVEFENRDAPAISQPTSSGIVLVSMTMSPCSQRPKKLSRIQDYGVLSGSASDPEGFQTD
jgi:hypothetical protein